MIRLPSDPTAVSLADWIEIELLHGETQSLSVDEITDVLGEELQAETVSDFDDAAAEDDDIDGLDSQESPPNTSLVDAALRELEARAAVIGSTHAVGCERGRIELSAGADAKQSVYGWLVLIRAPPPLPRREAGLSQSTIRIS